MEYDDPDSSVSLDRTDYPRNTGVVITIDHQLLNVDPTSEDSWFFVTGEEPRYRTLANIEERTTAEDDLAEDLEDADNARTNALDDAVPPGDAEAEAKAERKRVTTIAEAAIENPLTSDEQLARAHQIVGNSTVAITHSAADQAAFDALNDGAGYTLDNDGFDVTLDYDYDGDGEIADDTGINSLIAHIGTAQYDYELIAGSPARTAVNTADPPITLILAELDGSAQTDYIAIVGPLNDDGTPTEADDGGSAQADYEAVAGRGLQTTPETDTASPTTEDIEGINYKGLALMTYNLAIDGADLTGTTIAGFEPFVITTNDLLECTSGAECVITENKIWMKFTEDSSNDSKFTNVSDDTPNLKTTSDAQRGLSFSVEYDNTTTSAIGYTTTNIVIDEGDDWSSGEEIGVTLTDSDANTNSQDANDLDVSNPDHIIPTITIGEPLTLTNGGITATIGGTINGAETGVNDGAYSHRLGITTNGDEIAAGATGSLTITLEHDVDDVANGYLMVNYDLSAFDGATLTGGSGDLVDTYVVEANAVPTLLTLTFAAETTPPRSSAIAFDVFSFGVEDTTDPTDNINNAVYRLELEEDGDNSSDFIGTLEYVGLNQINILEEDTYTGIDAFGDSIILISDDDSVSIEYLDLDDTGGTTLFTAEADTPTHSGSVSLDSDGYKVADTVMVTVEDADLNVDSGRADVYTTSGDMITSANAVMPLLTVSIDGEDWNAGCGLGGLDASEFTLRETGSDNGVFTGTFAVPEKHCPSGSSDADDAVTVTGTDISAEYVDFRDDSGSIITVSASAGIRSNTGSVSLDRTVYPVPIGNDADTDTVFKTHNADRPLDQHDLTIYVSINDPDSDTSSNGIDTIPANTLEISVIRGSVPPFELTIDESTISETAPNSGIFEHTQTIAYDEGPDSSDCPSLLEGGCIVQGDILHVQYTDPSDASGSSNTVTDSATFDLRNGVLQVDKPGTTGYVIGTDMIVTLIEQDLNLDSDATETYPLRLIEWDSDAGSDTLDNQDTFGATPSNLQETGTDTGIFQVVITIPEDIDGESLQRGEEITLTYNDWGPSGSDYVGDKDEEINAVAYTSNFGASIELDQKVYTWTDKVYITIVAPDHNFDADQVDEIGSDETDYPINIKTQEDEIEGYKLVETGADTGIFSGELILTGVANDDLNKVAEDDDAGGLGPTDGRLAAEDSDGLAVVFENSDGDIVRASAIIQWNVGEVEWLEASYPALGSGIVRIIDPDMNLNPEAVDNFDVNVWSDSDVGGISLTVTETNAATGIFEGTVFFDDSSISSGHRLNVEEGDTVVAEYDDVTSPIEDETSVSATTLIGTIVPPLERAPINSLRAVDTFDNSIGAASVGQQVVITADLSNGQDRDQDFIFLIQVQDENGVTVSLNWVLGTLAAGQSFSPGASWTPTEAGTYDVTAFVWESIDNPTALSPTATIALTVN